MGENPAMSDPNLNHARKALASLDHLVVQDIFLTETAMLADVILPASAFPEKTGTFTNTDRRVQLGRQACLPSCTLLSVFVNVPVFSGNADAGKITSASIAVSVRKISCTTR